MRLSSPVRIEVVLQSVHLGSLKRGLTAWRNSTPKAVLLCLIRTDAEGI